MGCVGDVPMAYKGMDEPRGSILEVFGQVEVTTMTDRVLRGENHMESIASHVAVGMLPTATD